MNRRAALALGLAALAAPRAFAAEDPDDDGAAKFLLPPAVFEQSFWSVCDHALRSGTLRNSERRPIERLRGRGDEHATAVETVLEGFGAAPPRRPASKAEVPLPGFGEARSREDHLRFAAAAAQGSIGAWYVALQQLRQRDLIRLGAAAMAADAQHLHLLRGLQGAGTLPVAFVTGRPE